MAIEYLQTKASFGAAVTVDDAEGLLAWLQANPACALDLSACLHLHAATLQVLMAARPVIDFWPRDPVLRSWLEAALIST